MSHLDAHYATFSILTCWTIDYGLIGHLGQAFAVTACISFTLSLLLSLSSKSEPAVWYLHKLVPQSRLLCCREVVAVPSQQSSNTSSSNRSSDDDEVNADATGGVQSGPALPILPERQADRDVAFPGKSFRPISITKLPPSMPGGSSII